MLKPILYRLRRFFSAEILWVLEQLRLELQAMRVENAGLRREVSALQGDIAALRAELAERDARESALAKQMEASLLTIALGQHSSEQNFQ